MKIHDLPPIFLANMQHKYFRYPGRDEAKVVKLLCIDHYGLNITFDKIPPERTLKTGEIYYGYKDTSCADGFHCYQVIDYPVYRIFLPIFGCRKYKPSRFKILDTLILKKSDFHENSIKDLSLTDSKDKNKEQYSGPSKEVHTGALLSSGTVGFPNSHR